MEMREPHMDSLHERTERYVTPTLWVYDLWCAAAILCAGVEYLDVRRGRYGKPDWQFSNEDNRAYLEMADFRAGETVLNIQDYRKAFNFLSEQSRRMREQEERGGMTSNGTWETNHNN